MAKWQEGSITQASQFKKNNSAPLDDRDVVEVKADLIDSSVWTVSSTDTRYRGMIVYARSEDKHYVLIRDNDWDASDYSAWREIGSGGGTSGGEAEEYNPYNSPTYQFYSLANYSILEGGYRKSSLVSTGNIGTSAVSGLRIVGFTTSGTNPCVLKTSPNYTGSGKAYVAVNWGDLKTAISGKTSVCLNVHGNMTVGANIQHPSNSTVLTPSALLAFENNLPSNVVPLYAVFQKSAASTGTGTSSQMYRFLYFVTSTFNRLYINNNDGYYYSDGGNVSDFNSPGNGAITLLLNGQQFSGNRFTVNQTDDTTINIPMGGEEEFVFYKYNGTQTVKRMYVMDES